MSPFTQNLSSRRAGRTCTGSSLGSRKICRVRVWTCFGSAQGLNRHKNRAVSQFMLGIISLWNILYWDWPLSTSSGCISQWCKVTSVSLHPFSRSFDYIWTDGLMDRQDRKSEWFLYTLYPPHSRKIVCRNKTKLKNMTSLIQV